MLSVKKLFQDIINGENQTDKQISEGILYRAFSLDDVISDIRSDLRPLNTHLTKILFCKDNNQYWIREIKNKYLNSFPHIKSKSFGKITRKRFTKIINRLLETQNYKLYIIRANADLKYCSIELSQSNIRKLEKFIKCFFNEYCNNFKYGKNFTVEEIERYVEKCKTIQ